MRRQQPQRCEYERVDSNPTLNDFSGEPLIFVNRGSIEDDPQTMRTSDCFQGGVYNPAGIDLSAVDQDSDYELEQLELDDHIGEMPPSFNRRHRREGLFGPPVGKTSRSGTLWETSDLLNQNHINAGIEDGGDLSDDQSKQSDVESEEQGMRKYAKLILPHVGLVLLTCTYTVIGASIFYSCENPNELATKRHQLNLLYARQESFVTSLMELAAANETKREVWAEVARMHMHNMSDHLFVAFEKFFLTSKEVKQNTTIEIWTFSTAIFFAVTVVTTIGYGNPVPITQVGRMTCVMFAMTGIPLTLVTIADLGKFLSEHLIWLYGNYLKLKHFLCRRVDWRRKGHRERVCESCQNRGLTEGMEMVDEHRIPAMLVLAILVCYTALGGVLMSHLEPWSFFTSFYWSFITMTTVGFGDLMPRRDEYMYLILLYIVLGLAITTMCIDLVGVQYIRKIHYFGRKIQDARSALAVVGGKVVLVSELYANLMQKRAKNNARNAFIIDNLYVSKHVIPFIPSDIRWIRYIDQTDQTSLTASNSSLDLHSCRFCHSRFGSGTRVSISQHT